jgi:hypothetical protein
MLIEKPTYKKDLLSRWSKLQGRCYRPKEDSYKNYGGRGIKCEWGSFKEFYKDMSPSFKKGLTLDRIDNDKNYSKQNCRWATPKEQQNNRRNNVRLEYAGQEKTLSQWADLLDFPYYVLCARRKQGWTIEEMFEYPEWVHLKNIHQTYLTLHKHKAYT